MRQLPTTITAVFFFCLGLGLSTGCAGDDDAQIMKWCVDSGTATCKKAFECDTGLVKLVYAVYGAQSASDCANAASKMCADAASSDGSGGDDCINDYVPTDSEVQACIDQVEATKCEDVEKILETGACKTLDDKTTCETADAAGTKDTGGTTDKGTTTDSGPTTNYPIDTCVAAVTASCDLLVACAAGFPLLQKTVQGCSALVTASNSNIEVACQAYMNEGVPGSYPAALYLNTHTTQQTTACVSGQSQNCNEQFIQEAWNALDELLTSGDTGDTQAILNLLLAGCM